ncbi:porin [Sphingomonas sp. FW199]|uniref:porin n=1 Tax=Sphingomonas sp. FW199 TaxID=3400217 RepID=UPI003CE97900
MLQCAPLRRAGGALAIGAMALFLPVDAARAQTVEELQRQIDELKATVAELKAALAAQPASPPPLPLPPPQPAIAAAPPVAVAPAAPAAPVSVAVTGDKPRSPHWYERIRLRGYAQLRLSEIVAGDATAPAGVSRLRSVADGGISDRGNFSFRRIRLVMQGDLSDRLSFYFQPDFAVAVSNQTAGEPREAYVQLRDAYVDWFLDDAKSWQVRFGQAKVPFGWENLQSSSNRVPIDRTDAINSAVPGERDIGVTLFYTPPLFQRIWDRLEKDGQKLFGNYGAFSLSVYNGQGTNRRESNNGLMTVAMATWPIELGGALDGQVIELGGALLRNDFQPELRSGGVSATAFREERAGLHAILYPQPFGIQAEWNWGKGPEYDAVIGAIAEKPLTGGYVQTMFRIKDSPLGEVTPFARWQHYRGGWKAALNAPRLETDDWEVGAEFQFADPIELTLAYAHMRRREADERRTGQAEGDVIRAQLQWNY